MAKGRPSAARIVNLRAETFSSLSPPDHAAAEDDVLAIEDARLPRSRRADRTVEHDSRAPLAARRDGRRNLGRAVTDPNAGTEGTDWRNPRGKPQVRDLDHRGVEVRRASDDHLVGGRIDRKDVQTLGRGDVQAAPLADGEPEVPVVFPEPVPARVLDGAGKRRQREPETGSRRGDEGAGARPLRDEADLLALLLVGGREPGPPGVRPHLPLREPPNGESRRRELLP